MVEKSSKLSGRQKAQKNSESFTHWVTEREESNDWKQYISKDGDKLNRTEIANECGFGRSAFVQNPTLAKKLQDTELLLREKGVLSHERKLHTQSFRAEADRTQQSRGRSNDRVKALEQQLAALIAERDDLKKRIETLEFLDLRLTSTGRIPH